MSTDSFYISVTNNNIKLHFILGKFTAVFTDLFQPQKKIARIILPCSLYDLAQIAEHPEIAETYQYVDVFTTDGMPLVWWFRLHTKRQIERVYGPDLMQAGLNHYQDQKHLILCPSSEVRAELEKKLSQRLKKRRVLLLTVGDSKQEKERQRLARELEQFRPQFVWVGIGSPNQVSLAGYLKTHLSLPATYFCVGAAVPFLAGTVTQAPRWMQQNGLEWLFRLVIEPTRLWKRYLVVNPLFVLRLLFSKVQG
ncbi:WecB/TagA/CpsF family glycosyltransferase [Patescibacteria group bacterium]|nr:WecB/TagA/CpsF family glycosyltransferase [Patescibacteria group bacterium]